MRDHYVVVDVNSLIPVAVFEKQEDAAKFVGDRLLADANDPAVRPFGSVVYKTVTTETP
jgi:hypothetical protein